MKELRCQCGHHVESEHELQAVREIGYCPSCDTFIGVYEAAAILRHREEEAQWNRYCAEHWAREQQRNHENVKAAFLRNSNATSADML